MTFDLVSGPTGSVRNLSLNNAVALGDRVVFPSAQELATNLWSTDGTTSGTLPLFDPCSRRTEDCVIQPIGQIQGRSLWQADDLVFSTDGTRRGSLHLFDAVGSAITRDGAHIGGPNALPAPEIAWSDGTELGTTLLPIATPKIPVQALPLGQDSVATLWCDAGSTIFECVNGQVWISDGTAFGTQELVTTDFPETWMHTAGDLVVLWDREAPDLTLYVADPRDPGELTVLATETSSGFPYLNQSADWILFEVGFFPSDLLVTNGTVGGTKVLSMDGRVGPQIVGSTLYATDTTTAPQSLARYRLDGAGAWQTVRDRSNARVPAGRVFELGAYHLAAHSQGVWSIDPSGRATKILDGGFSEELSIFGSVAYFVNFQGLWQTDGTLAGTARVAQHPPMATLLGAVPLGEGALAGSTDGFWRSSTDGGLERLETLPPFETGSRPRSVLAAKGGRAFLNPLNLQLDTIVWTTGGAGNLRSVDVTPLGCPRILVDLRGARGSSEPGMSLFECLTEDAFTLWATDGTAAGTREILDDVGFLAPDSEWEGLSGRLLFQTSDALWATDGTPEGTLPLLAESGRVQGLQRVGSVAYFFYSPPLESEYRVWVTDGTQAGTHVADPAGPLFERLPGISPMRDDSKPFQAMGADVVYRATTSTQSGASVWRLSPATGEQTVVAESLYPLDRLFEVVDDRIVVSAGGIHAIDPADGSFEPLTDGDVLFGSVNAGGLALFRKDFSGGLWVTDGSTQGTREILASGERRITQADTYVVSPEGDQIFFSGELGTHGKELLVLDVATQEVRLVQDIYPGGSSNPSDLTFSGDTLYFAADDGIHGSEVWSLDLAATGCTPSPFALCLEDDNFQVTVAVRDFAGNLTRGNALPLTEDTGAFWFFSPNNIEQLVKVLDGRGINDFHWLFYGALSNVEYYLTATDTRTGAAARYGNPSGNFASVGDTNAFHEDGPFASLFKSLGAEPTTGARTRVEPNGTCVPSELVLCLGGRFSAEVSWRDFAGNEGVGTAAPLVEDSGAFWFFSDENLELLVKVLDGTDINGHHWVFYGSLTNVAFELTITDEQTGERVTYSNELGNFASNGDTFAF